MMDEANLPPPGQAPVEPRVPVRRILASADLAAAALAAIGAVVAVALLPDGSALRVALVAPVILVVPGYLALQTLLLGERRSRLMHVLLALGISPAIVGILALSTAFVQGGFRSSWIVAIVTVACLGLAVLAEYRRQRLAEASTRPRTSRGVRRRAPVAEALPQPRAR